MTTILPPPASPDARERLAAYGLDLATLAEARLARLDPTSTLDGVIQRLFDRHPQRHTVCAFGAAL